MKKRQKLGLGGEAMFFPKPVNKYRKPQFLDPGYGKGGKGGFRVDLTKRPPKIPNYFTGGGTSGFSTKVGN